MKKLDIELFRFNHKTDYLPYYKKYTLKNLDATTTILDLFNQINEIENFNYANDNRLICKINQYFVNADQLLSEVIEKTGTNIQINPVSTYTVTHDFELNETIYENKINIFNDYLSSEQKQSYINDYRLEYYASNTLNFNKEYIGEHCLMAAYDLIVQHPHLRQEILNIITDDTTGINYHTSLLNRVFDLNNEMEEKTAKLLDMVLLQNPETQNFATSVESITQTFNDFNIAVYEGIQSSTTTKNLIAQANANYIELEAKNDDLNLKSFDSHKEFTYKIAGTMLLEAKDKNADFLIVEDQSLLTLLDQQQKKIECAIGREINLPVISSQQFVQLLQGQKDPKVLNFTEHKTPVSFL